MFDRVIVLSEGYTIFNGPPNLVKEYFEKMGLQMSRFSNPADKLSNIASEPRATLTQLSNTLELSKACETNLLKFMTIQNQEMRNHILKL